MINVNDKRLIYRYLLWCYKTTKEDLDRIDRYFTQHLVDNYILGILRKSAQTSPSRNDPLTQLLINEFADYMKKKQEKAIPQKFIDPTCQQLAPRYLYLQQRLRAIEMAILSFLGKKTLTKVCYLYEEEMTKRILKARDHS